MPLSLIEEAVANLKRHGYPFAPLLQLVRINGVSATVDDASFGKVLDQSDETLKGHMLALRQKADRLVKLITQVEEAGNSTHVPTPGIVAETL